jgi:serine/threonine protein kinase
MLKKLNHPGIVKVHEAFNNPAKGTIYLVMELIKGFTVKKYVKKINLVEHSKE